MRIKHHNAMWDKIYLVYYVVVVLLLFFLMRPFVPMNDAIRNVLYVAIFLPAFFRIKYFLPVFVFFMSFSGYSFSPVLPTHWGYSLILVIFALLFAKKKQINILSFVAPLFFVLLDFIHGGLATWSPWIFIMILLGALICDKKDICAVVLSLILVSVLLSLLYLLYFDSFEWMKHASDNEYYSTSGWMNHNKFDSSLGCGALLAIAVLSKQFRNNFNSTFYRVIAIASIVLTIIVMLKDASRGSILSLVCSAMVLIAMAKTKPRVKVSIIVTMLIIVVVALAFTSADYVVSRFSEQNVSTAGNRLEIWNEKIYLFFSDLDFFKLLFGIGWTECLNLGTDISTHNDWITAFVAFGFVGLLVYSSIYIALLFMSYHKNAISLSVLLFLFLESMVLEPFFRGNGMMVLLYIIAMKYSIVYKRKKTLSVQSLDNTNKHQ